MIVITFAVYLGVSSVEDVAGWKDKNIKYIHLVTGLLLIALGILIFTGLL